MIRPITVFTFLLACGSGMYLYQAKHRVSLLDQQIDQTVKQTETIREQSRALHAEWMLLNDPDRLHRLAAHYLTNLQPVAPTQFTDLVDLDSRLPPAAPPGLAAKATVVASAANSAPAPDQAAGAATADQATTGSTDRSPDGRTDRVKVDARPNPPAAPPAARSGNIAAAPVSDEAPKADHAPRPVTAQAPQLDHQPVTARAPRADHAPRTATAQAPRADHAPRTATAQAPPVDHAPRTVTAQAPPVDHAPRTVTARAPQADHAPRIEIAQAPHPTMRVADLTPVRPHPVVASVPSPQHAPLWRPATRRPMVAETVPSRFVRSEQRPMAVMRPSTAPQSAYGGSMLGMARGASNLPRPVPLNADYTKSGG